MKNRYIINSNLFYFFFLIFLLCSCRHDNTKSEKHATTIIDKIEIGSKSYHGVSVSSDKYISGKTIKVIERGHTFLIPERKSQIELYACTECHTKSLKEMRGEKFKKAHWNIKIHHASIQTMNCTTCHEETNLDELKSLTGERIDFNRSYQLCSQCHQKQFKDWVGGAHGKSAGGWAPPRASMTCVNCHNPHKPRFESRWPARYNTQKAKERK